MRLSMYDLSCVNERINLYGAAKGTNQNPAISMYGNAHWRYGEIKLRDQSAVLPVKERCDAKRIRNHKVALPI